MSYLLRISGRYTRSLGAVHDPQAAARSPIGCVLVALLVSDVDVMTSVQLQRLPSRSHNKTSAPIARGMLYLVSRRPDHGGTVHVPHTYIPRQICQECAVLFSSLYTIIKSIANMSKSLHSAAAFVLSCGTVTLDLNKSKALLIRWHKTGEVMLPKGRKDIGETLENAALRETWEETGYRASLLPLPFLTQATSPPNSQTSEASTRLVTEPICVTQRDRGGVRKIIFWFAAQADSTAPEGKREQQEGEDFETVWTDLDMVGQVLSHDDDREVARLVIDALRGLPAA